MQEQRNNTRYQSLARACVPTLFKGEALLRDISVTGCCIECTMNIEAEPETRYAITILPEAASHIGGFELTVVLRWTRPDHNACELGFFIVESPKGKQFQRYVDYLSYYSSVS